MRVCGSVCVCVFFLPPVVVFLLFFFEFGGKQLADSSACVASKIRADKTWAVYVWCALCVGWETRSFRQVFPPPPLSLDLTIWRWCFYPSVHSRRFVKGGGRG